MRTSPRMKWFVLLFTFVFAIGMNSFRNSFQFFMLPMADAFHADRSLISVSVSIFMITTGIVQFFVGFFIDRFSVRKIMALGAVCISASFLVLPYSPNVHVFSAIYGVLGGIGYSCAVGVTTQYFISRWFDIHKGLALAILTNANSAGLLLLSPIWAAAPYHAGWQSTYTILGIVMAAVLLPLLVFGMKHPPHAQAESVKKSYDWRGFWNVMKQSRLIHILYFGVFTCGFTMGIIDAHLVPILKDAHVSHINGMMAAFGAFIIIGGLLAGWLSDLLGSRSVMLSILFFIRLLSLICLLIPILGIHHSDLWYFGFILLFGLSYTGVIPLTAASISESYQTGLIGSLLGINFFIHQVAGALSVYAGGLFFDMTHGYLLIVAVCIVFVGLSAVIELVPFLDKQKAKETHHSI
ncbi:MULTISPECIES: MFS transporter [Bacillus]|uniref:MFS transporter n=1 Tax=Bacillus TaxID=1386 RepID=UPI0004A3C58F|nr:MULTISPECIES: MFS transporter [Bacillus]AOL32156.1 MFS transporter [Alkalicoccobacillus gibsonii]AOL28760.1 MFS transporter [Bacillus sp. FJAT-14266]AYK61694.1 MFS transporter [Bacillus subtilis subsp. subtilis]KFC29025.1 MFS transporter [Bacillus subtilis]KKJ79358.1 putative MFS-type transporter YcxA [Bacillus subtilis]